MSANHSKKYLTCRQASGSVRRKHGCFCNKHASSASIPVSPCGAVYRNMFTPKPNMCIIYYLVYIQYRVKFLLILLLLLLLFCCCLVGFYRLFITTMDCSVKGLWYVCVSCIMLNMLGLYSFVWVYCSCLMLSDKISD